MTFPLFTSIKPPNGAAELSYLRDCIDSWRTAGFTPVAVNGPSEIKAMRSLDLPAEFVALPMDGKPRIGALLDAVRASGARFAGIINNDCRIMRYPNVATSLQSKLAGSFILGWRMDVGGDLPPSPMQGGFDAFFFDTSILPDDDAGFSIGEPWWDYWFPLVAKARGARIETLSCPLLTHRRHALNWNDNHYQRGGTRLQTFLDDRKHPDFSGQSLDVLIRAIPAWIYEQPQTVSLLGPELAEIESMLQLRGNAMISRTYLLHDHAALEYRCEHLESRLRASETEKAHLTTAIAEARAETLAIKHSTCWRATAPFRKLGTALLRRQRPSPSPEAAL